MRIIPAIDIIDGKCVRLVQGDYGRKTIYNENPLAVARAFREAGFRYLHLVDLDGARAGKVVNWSVVEEIAGETDLNVDFGGGVKTERDISKLFGIGVAQVNLGSVAVKSQPAVADWIKTFGAGKIIISADVKNDVIQVGAWQQDSSLTIDNFLTGYQRLGVQYVACTDIATDGMLSGPNLGLYKRLRLLFPEIRLIASGGISSLADVQQLATAGLDGAIIGKALYENKISMQALTGL